MKIFLYILLLLNLVFGAFNLGVGFSTGDMLTACIGVFNVFAMFRCAKMLKETNEKLQ